MRSSTIACALSAIVLMVLVSPAAGEEASAEPHAASSEATPIPYNENDPPFFGCIDIPDEPFRVCTNDVRPESAAYPAVVDELERLVDLTAGPDDEIRISMFQWWYRQQGSNFDYSHLKSLTESIINATIQRNVDVKVMIDDVSDPRENPDLTGALPDGEVQPFTRLRQALGEDLIECGYHPENPNKHDSRCLANGNENAFNHNKFFLVTVDGEKYTTLTSSNLVPYAQLAYENVVTIAGDRELYHFFKGYWQRLKNQSWGSWNQGEERERIGSLRSPNGEPITKGFVFPRPKYQDPFLDVLEKVTGCPNSADRKIWISMSGVTIPRLNANGDAIPERIDELTDMGCTVRMLLDDHVVSEVQTRLRNAGAQVVTVPYLHHKFLIVDAKAKSMTGGTSHTRDFVWTGSENLSWSGAWRNGESTVWIEDHKVVRSYVSHFTCVWNRNYLGPPENLSECG